MCNALKDPEALTEMFEALRVDSGGSTSSSEAAAAKASEGTLLFELLDLNRDGRLSRMEIARGLKTLVKAGVPVGVTADAFFKAADSDGDAKVLHSTSLLYMITHGNLSAMAFHSISLNLCTRNSSFS